MFESCLNPPPQPSPRSCCCSPTRGEGARRASGQLVHRATRMKAAIASLCVAIAFAILTVARGGHELPIYPSFYPHEIEITTAAPDRAAAQLVDNKMHAYVGQAPRFAGAAALESIRAVA